MFFKRKLYWTKHLDSRETNIVHTFDVCIIHITISENRNALVFVFAQCVLLNKISEHFKANEIPLFQYANMSVQYTAIVRGCKNCNFQVKKVTFFLFLLKR